MITQTIPMRLGLRLKDVWLADSPKGVNPLELAVLYNCRSTQRHSGFIGIPKKALFIDLRDGAEKILETMNQDTRYKIRRAEREGVVFSVETDLGAFADLYDEFARSKENFSPISRKRLEFYWPNLTVTKTTHHGTPLGMHAYFVDPQTRRTSLLWAASLFRHADTSLERNMRARFNLSHFWSDINFALKQGCLDYDFGYFGDVSKGMESVNRFKLQFPCQLKPVTTYYSSTFWLWKKILDRHTPL